MEVSSPGQVRKFGGMFDHNPALVRDVVEAQTIFYLSWRYYF